MFWDRVAGVYDVFGKWYNGSVNRKMCTIVAAQINRDDVVLECACGTGMITVAVAPRCRSLCATDFSDGMLKRTRKNCQHFENVHIRKADITDLRFPEGHFDAVIAANVIHLLDDPYQALADLDKVCRPGGKLIIPTYVNHENTGKTNGVTNAIGKAGADFKRQFTFGNYRTFFEEAGYRDVDVIRIEGRVPCAVAVITKP